MLRYENNKGIVLVTLLLFMQILTFLGLFLLQSSLLGQKIAHGTFKQQSIFEVAESVLQTIETKMIQNDPNCLIAVINSKDLSTKPLDWWQINACSGQFSNYFYYYVVESLGQDACAEIKNSKNQIADYFRVTLNVIEENFDTREMLQSTVIKMHNADSLCATHLHSVMIGRQAWCQII